MDTQRYTITLLSPEPFGTRAPSDLAGHVLVNASKLAGAAIRMAFGSRSTARGRRPKWLEAASDIRFVGISANGHTGLHFEAPRLGEAAEELYSQKELWPTRPEPNLTGLDLFAGVVQDIASENEDSDRFDAALLKRIRGLARNLGPRLDAIELSGGDGGPARIDRPMLERADSMATKTPLPQRVRVAGHLDMVRASTQSWAIKLQDGQEVKGTIPEEQVRELSNRLEQPVIVLGTAVYRASGKLLRIDADTVQPAEGNIAIWSRVPAPKEQRLDAERYRQVQGRGQGVAAILGQWPGEETDEEIAAFLEDLS